MGLITKYKQFLSTLESNHIPISLEEGNTPLIRARAIEKECAVEGLEVFLKFEGANPSGSFKDRGMTMAVTQAVARGLQVMVCASTGNTSASAAAYSACARSLGFEKTRCAVLIPDGYVALGKLAQAIAYGAQIVQIKGNFDQALKIVRDLAESSPHIALVNSVNPDRLEGQKTAAFEICENLGDVAPDILAIPVGNAGNISAYWKGFKEYKNANLIEKSPKMFGFQAAGAAPIVQGRPITNPQTIATAIRIGNPASWQLAQEAVDQSSGLIDSVTDEQIIEAYKFIHSQQGITCEPASASSVAGIFKLSKANKLPKNSRIVCVLTGHGLKDPQTAIDTANFEPLKTEATLNSVKDALRL